MSRAEAFWKRIEQHGDCWLWMGPTTALHVGRRGVKAPHMAWELTFGKVPRGWAVIRTCGQSRCVRPDHHWLATPAEHLAHARRCLEQKIGTPVPQPNRKVTREQVLAIRVAHAEGLATLATLALVHGLTREGVRAIVRRRCWKDVEPDLDDR